MCDTNVMKVGMVQTQELHIQSLENEFPALTLVATSEAFKQSLKNGNTVLISKEYNKLYEVTPDGALKFIKRIAKGIFIRGGLKNVEVTFKS